MTGAFLFVLLVAALLASLEFAHHRRGPFEPRPGEDVSRDRDRARLRSELQWARRD